MWRRAVIVGVGISALLVAVAVVVGRPPELSRPDIVLVTVDTLRADRLPIYGAHRDTAPFLSSLASEGVVLDHAYATSSWTAPSMASILTGLYPRQHGVERTAHDDGHGGFVEPVIHDTVETLAERLKASGYGTFAVVTNLHMTRELGHAQGFDEFRHLRWVDAEPVHAAVAELSPRLASPFFLWVHLYDPHMPYRAVEPWVTTFDAESAVRFPLIAKQSESERRERIRQWAGFEFTDLHLLPPPGKQPVVIETLRNLYDSEIRDTDRWLREIVAATGIGRDDVLFVTADHGEEFRDHGAWAHGGRLFEEQTHVPLVVHVPRVAAYRGRTVAQPVQILDVMPTLLTWFGLSGAAACQGRDLTPLVTSAPGTEVAAAPIYAEETTYVPGAELKSLRVGHWKMIRSAADTDRYGAAQLFDLAADPRETTNVARKERRRLFELDEQMQRLERGWARNFRPEQGAKEELDEQTRNQLKALGYVE